MVYSVTLNCFFSLNLNHLASLTIPAMVKDPSFRKDCEFEDMNFMKLYSPTHFALLLVLGGTVALLVGARL